VSQAQIERYFGDQCLIPALRAIGQSRQTSARADLRPHHENYFEIHLVMDGAVDWWVKDETYTLLPGSVYLTKPGEVHGGVGNTIQPCTLTWLQVDAEALTDADIRNELELIAERTWLGAHELVNHVTTMLAEVRNPQPDSPRVIAAYLQVFLAHLLRQYRHRVRPPEYPPKFKRLLEYIEAHLAGPELDVVGVDDLCACAGLSRSRVFQLFGRYAGQSPASYINMKRIERAKNLLRKTDTAITQIALDLGFSSSQHFATSFKRATGLTPKAFRVSGHAGSEGGLGRPSKPAQQGLVGR
jgi:AraC family L-rhamnose operon regulatory protein RhaS